jgi:hypothetical protein
MSLFIPLPLYLNMHYTVYHMCVCVWVGVHGCIRCIQSVNTDIARIQWTKGDRVCFHPERLTIAHYSLYRLPRVIFYVHKGMTPTHWKFDVARRIHRCFRTRRTAPGYDRAVVTTVSLLVDFPGRLPESSCHCGRNRWQTEEQSLRGYLQSTLFFSFASPTYLHWTLLFESTFSFLQ